MQKKPSILALAIPAVLASLANAAAAQSSVTIYGSLDAAIRHQTGTAPTNAAGSQISGTPAGTLLSLEGKSVASASRIGFRGTEDLGGGANVHFVLEAGIDIDGGMQNDANALFNRQVVVGATGSWGTLDLGRQYSVAYKTLVAYDPMSGAYQVTAVASPGSANVAGCFPVTAGCVRFNNDVQYSKTFGGLTVRAEAALGETAGDSKTGTSLALGASYKNGSFNAGAAYTAQHTPPSSPTAAYPGAPANAERSNITLGGGYAEGALRVAAGYVRDRTATNGGDSSLRQVWAGMSYLATPPWKFSGAYYHHQLRGPAGTGAGAQRVTEADGTAEWGLFLIEARYLLSKRTSVYGMVSRQAWSKGIQFLPTAKHGGTGQRGVTLGISHQF